MIAPKTNASTRPEIEHQLRRCLVPNTGNRDALIELGFSPAYPHLAHDEYYGSLWTRTIDAHSDPSIGRRSHARTLVVERAFHVRADHRARRTRLRHVAVCAAVAIGHRAYRPLSVSRLVGAARIERLGRNSGSDIA